MKKQNFLSFLVIASVISGLGSPAQAAITSDQEMRAEELQKTQEKLQKTIETPRKGLEKEDS